MNYRPHPYASFKNVCALELPSPPICALLLNMSIPKARIPTDWKKADITLIPKDGNLADINNFRPIAILPVTSKIMENLIQSQTKHVFF